MQLEIKNGNITITGDINFSMPDSMLEAKKISASETEGFMNLGKQMMHIWNSQLEFEREQAVRQQTQPAQPRRKPTQAKRK